MRSLVPPSLAAASVQRHRVGQASGPPLNPGRLRCGSPSARAVLCEHAEFRQALAQLAAAQR
jgi:hypothetical protein